MNNRSSAAFVMPFYGDGPDAARYLEKACASVRAQTDGDWTLVIVDDASPHPETRTQLKAIGREDPGRIVVVRLDENSGPGNSRNVGVDWAARHGAEMVLFHDSDDLSPPERLARTRAAFAEDRGVDLVYTAFRVVDENDDPVPIDRLTPSIAEALESHRDPVVGDDVWIRIGTETGYTSLTSTVAVRTPLAQRHPFPCFRGSEDTHTWYRLSAGGGRWAFLPDVVAGYRVPQGAAGSSDRGRIGAVYYQRMTRASTAGFVEALDISLSRGRLEPEQVPSLVDRFLLRLARTMRRENEHAVADAIEEACDHLMAHPPGSLDLADWTPRFPWS